MVALLKNPSRYQRSRRSARSDSRLIGTCSILGPLGERTVLGEGGAEEVREVLDVGHLGGVGHQADVEGVTVAPGREVHHPTTAEERRRVVRQLAEPGEAAP